MAQRRFTAALLAAASALAAGEAAAQMSAGRQAVAPASPRTFQMARAEGPVKVDGVLDEAAWAAAAVIAVDREYMPGDDTPAPVATECRVTFDDGHLYLGCLATDPDPSAIRANLSDRDAAGSDDYVQLTIDPFNDQRRAFSFYVNPLGVQMDASYSEVDDTEDFSWDAIWASSAKVTQGGYVVEAAIPFKSFRLPRMGEVQTWGVIVERNYPRSVRHQLRSSRTDRNESCLLCQADKLTGLRNVRTGQDVDFTPTFTSSRSDVNDAFPDRDFVNGDVRNEVGVSARWGITPNLNLNATVNPDFSQVEADAAQLVVNERFALNFPEKRPFFLEGADFFSTPTATVFTRSVVDPLAGLKLTGKEGRNAFGLFGARDRVNTVLLPSNQATGIIGLPGEVTTAVARYRRDVGTASTLGVMYTGRDGEGGYHNHVAGVDGFLRVNPSNYLRFQYSRSFTEYPEGAIPGSYGQPEGGFDGGNLFAQYLHASRSWVINAIWEDVGEDFRADAGFITRADYRGVTATAERVFWGAPGSWFNRMGVMAYVDRLEDHDGRETDRGYALVGTYSGPLQSSAVVGLGYNRKYFAGQYFELYDARPSFEIRPNGRVKLSVAGRFGEDIDFANARKANLFEIAPGVELRLGRRVELGLDHAVRRLSTQDGDTLGSGEIVRADLSQARLVYHFSSRAFVRGILQYVDTDMDPSLNTFPAARTQESLFTQLLFSYKLNPQTVLFAGYSDDRAGVEQVSLTPTGRSFFLKLGYNFRM
jgi:hypothetical protein